MSADDLPRLDRRTALKWMATAMAAAAAHPTLSLAQTVRPAARGYGTDPLLNQSYQPGDFWPLTFTREQRRAAAALCAMIIPAEGANPSAVDVGVHDFIDEWVSAPYPEQAEDRPRILAGLAWIDAEAQRRFGRDFADLDDAQRAAICDDLCHLPDARPEHREAAQFFARFRDLTAGGYFSTPAGMKDLGYVGNMPLAEFKGPPPEVLRHLGLA